MAIVYILSIFIMMFITYRTPRPGSNSNTVNRLLRISENQARSRKWIALLLVLQYAGTIAMMFALMAMHGPIFGYQINVDTYILLCILLAGVAAMFIGHHERRMIQIVRAIKDSEQAKPE